jgi:hypothetical protein
MTLIENSAIMFCTILYFTEAASEKAGQLYTLKASIQQATSTKPALTGKQKVVCNKFYAV